MKDIVIIPLLFILTLVPLLYFVMKKVRSKPSLYIANSHYNSRSDSATLASYDNLAGKSFLRHMVDYYLLFYIVDLILDEESNVYSDDEPLVLA